MSAAVLNPRTSELCDKFAEQYAELRKHKGVTVEQAREIIHDVSYFGTMLVHNYMVDGMVSGATHTTAHTVRPAFEIIGTTREVSTVSSIFLMCLADRVLAYGDCAIVPDPTSEQLADIAISSARTAAQFGIDPRVAMLSYSTGTSGTGADVDKVRTATELVRKREPDLLVEGPIQYDAAVDATVAKAKMPDSKVAGRATVLIFPTSTPATTPTRRCSAARVRSQSARCCRALTNRSTTCLEERWSRTSSIPSRSPRSRRRADDVAFGSGAQLRIVIGEIPTDRP